MISSKITFLIKKWTGVGGQNVMLIKLPTIRANFKAVITFFIAKLTTKNSHITGRESGRLRQLIRWSRSKDIYLPVKCKADFKNAFSETTTASKTALKRSFLLFQVSPKDQQNHVSYSLFYIQMFMYYWYSNRNSRLIAFFRKVTIRSIIDDVKQYLYKTEYNKFLIFVTLKMKDFLKSSG